MAITVYTYSIAADITAAALDNASLTAEINADVTPIPDLIGVAASGDALYITFENALSAPEEAALDAVVLAHSGIPTSVVVPDATGIKSARLATTANFAVTMSGDANRILTVDAAGVFTVDGVATVLDDAVLFQGQTNKAQNGLFKCVTAGAIGIQAVFTRDDELTYAKGEEVFVQAGTLHAGKRFQVKTSPAVVGTNDLDYAIAATTIGTAGFMVERSDSTTASRTLTGLSAKIGITNPAGTTADPVFDTSALDLRGFKVAVACYSIGNLALTGEQVIDGVQTATSRVAAVNQTDPTENGVYVSAAGAWARATDLDEASEFIYGVWFQITGGTAYAGMWVQMTTTGAVVVDTTSLAFTRADLFLASPSTFPPRDNSLPINGNVAASLIQFYAGLYGINFNIQWFGAAALTVTEDGGGVLTEVGNGALSMDGGAPDNGEYVWLNAQADATQNGPYEVTDKGSAGTPFILTPISANLGMIFVVDSGDVYKSRFYMRTRPSEANIKAYALGLAGKGTDSASANDMTVVRDGKLHVVTGAVQINAITTGGWAPGDEIVLEFAGAPTVKHNTAGGAGTALLLLAGSADFLAAADSYLGLIYNGVEWHETYRKVP